MLASTPTPAPAKLLANTDEVASVATVAIAIKDNFFHVIDLFGISVFKITLYVFAFISSLNTV